MRKLFIMACAVAMTTLSSCGSKTAAPAESQDTTATTEATTAEATEADDVVSTLSSQLEAKDAKGLEATITAVKEKYAELVKAGKVEEAKAYASKAQEFLNKHTDELKAIAAGNTTVESLVNTIANLPTSAKATAAEAATAVGLDANAAKEAIKAGAEQTVEDAKAAAKAKAEAAKADANAKVEAAKAKAANEVNKKANEVNKKVNDAVSDAAKKALKGLGQ